MEPILAIWIDDLPTDATRDPVPIDEARDRALAHCNGLMDGGGHLIEGWSTIQGNTTEIRVWKVDHATGARTALATVLPPTGFKADDFALWQAGTALIVGIVAHEAISDPTRRNIYARAVLPGVLVPYPAGAEPRGAGIDPALLGGQPSPPPAPQPSEPIDYARIQQTVAAEVDRLIANFGGGGVRGGIMEKVEDGLVRVMSRALQAAAVQNPDAPDAPEGVDPRVAQFQAVFADTLFNNAGLYQRLNDTVYEVVGKYLDPKPGKEGDN